MSKNYQTKTARILAVIIQMMEIDDCQILERVNAHTVSLIVAPKWNEDASLLIGRDAQTFKSIRSICNFSAHREELVLDWREITKPNGDTRQRPKATPIDIDQLRETAEKMAGGVFGPSRAAVESVGDFFQVTIETPTLQKRIIELIFENVINAIAKSRAVQIGVTFAVKPIESQPNSAAGRFVGEVER
jgi:hypothetical protein